MRLLSLQDLHLLFLKFHPSAVMVQLLVLLLPGLQVVVLIRLNAQHPVQGTPQSGVLGSLLLKQVFPATDVVSVGLFDLLLLDVLLLVLLKSLDDSAKRSHDLFTDNLLVSASDHEWLCTTLEQSDRVERGEMRLLRLHRDDPRLNTVQNHVIYHNSVSQVNRLLHAQNA